MTPVRAPRARPGARVDEDIRCGRAVFSRVRHIHTKSGRGQDGLPAPSTSSRRPAGQDVPGGDTLASRSPRQTLLPFCQSAHAPAKRHGIRHEVVMPTNEKSVTLYLTSWQIRMIRDFMPAMKVSALDRMTKVKVSIIDKKQWVMYRQPFDAFKAGQWNLYLTDEQINMVTQMTGMRVKFSALNVSPEMVESGALVFG